jgi:hypothetical protein
VHPPHQPCTPRPRARVPGVAGTLTADMPRLVAAVAALALAILVTACGGAQIPITSFDPASACTTDGRQPGAYPDLEALLPAAYESAAPTSVDSGRTCTSEALGTLVGRGIGTLRFAGAIWGLGGTSGLTVAVFEADGLDPAAMIEFYEAGARANRKTEKLQTTDTTAGGRPARRLDVLQSDGAYQTAVAWPTGVDGRVMVLLAADVGDAKVAAAVDGFAAP